MTIAASECGQINRRSTCLSGCLVENEVGEQLMRHSLGCVAHRCGQCLVEVGYSRQQTPRIRKSPVPAGILWKGEHQAMSFTMVPALRPEQNTTGPAGFTR